MVTIGVDAHKSIHQALALDEAGTVLGHWRGANTGQGWQSMLTWSASFATPQQWGIEGAWNYGRGLAQYLVGQHTTVYEVNPRWTAVMRRKARKPGKSDRLDALAVAKLVRDEGQTLPRITAEDTAAVLEVLVSEREAAVNEATRLRNQLHQQLYQLTPDYTVHIPSLRTDDGLQAAEEYSVPDATPLQHQRMAAIRRLVQRLRLASHQAALIADEIRRHASEQYRPLTELPGVQLLTAGALAASLGPGQRFLSEAQLAAYAGVAPLEASSAGTVRHRLNRGGNRRLNAILYRIALTQVRSYPKAQAYVARRKAEGKTWGVPLGPSGPRTEALLGARDLAALATMSRESSADGCTSGATKGVPTMKDETNGVLPSCSRLPFAY